MVSTRAQTPQPIRHADPDGEAQGADRFLRIALLSLSAALAIVAYREFLSFDPVGRLQAEIEDFFFLPSYTSPRAILVLGLWLLYRRRERLWSLPRPARPPGLSAGLMGAALCVLAWATYTGASDLLALSLSLGALGAAVLHRGVEALRVLAVPAAFLLLAIPIPAPLLNGVVYELQLATASYTGWLLHQLGVPALVWGDQILGADQRFAVIEGCSGLRSMETLTIIAVLLIDLFRRRGLHAAVILLAAPAVAFGLNGFRAVALILNPHSEIVAIHNLQGIGILLSGLVILYLLDGLLARFSARHPRDPRGRAVAGTGWRRAGALSAVTALAAGISMAIPRWENPSPPPLDTVQEVPRTWGGWTSEFRGTDQTFLGWVRFGSQIHRRYAEGGDQVDLFIGVGDRSRRLRVPFSAKTALPGSGWTVEEAGLFELPVDEPGERTGRGDRVVRRSLVRSQRSRRLVYSWTTGSDGLASEIWRSAWALDWSPFRREGETVVVRISTEIRSEVGASGADARREAESRLRRFLPHLEEELTSLEHRLGGKGFPDFPDVGKDFPLAREGGNIES